jgi:hypothetical protein
MLNRHNSGTPAFPLINAFIMQTPASTKAKKRAEAIKLEIAELKKKLSQILSAGH